LFTTAFKSAYDPYFFKIANSRPKDEAVSILYKTNHVFLLVLILTSFLITIYSKEAIFIFFNETYYPAMQVVPLVSLGYLFSQNSALLNVMVYQEKKTKVIMYITIICAALNIGLNFILIPMYGIIGAAFSTLICYFVLFLLTYNYAKKYYFIPFNWIQLAPIAMTLILISIIFYYIQIPNLFLSLSIKTLISAIVLIGFFFKYKNQMAKIFSFKK
jgi:O-antigen/teichoic acid export membrane protein